MLIFWSLVRNSVVLAVYLLFSVACFLTVHEHLPKYYTTLFNAVTDAIELISRSEVSEAMACLVTAQQKAEEIYISEA